MKVAIVHDYLIEYGGAERVVETLHEIFPDSFIFTAFLDLKGLGAHGERVKKWKIKTSWMQNFPLARRLISPFRIFAPMTFEGMDFSEYDVVISSCNVYFSKAIIIKPQTLNISYIHTPPHYLYGYATSFNYKKHWWTRIGGEIMNHFLRIYDFETSQRPDILIANSKNVQERIKKFYRRDSVVIYPPVDIEKFKVQNSKSDKTYFLSVGRLVRGKGIEVTVAACSELNLPLKVVGTGPELANLKKIAGSSVEFLGQVKDNQLPELYSGAKATIVSNLEEDFGIVPVESQAAGTPVIAIKSGGYKETISDKTGLFFEVGNDQDSKSYFNKKTVENLVAALNSFDSSKFDSEDCIKNAQKFSKENFKNQVLALIKSNLSK
jgi:glycosyltransferase involved in cell wall biosynthesis